MVKPPTNGRMTKVLNAVSGGSSEAYSTIIDDLLMFNDVMIYLYNAHVSQTVDYTVYATVDRNAATIVWETIQSKTTLAAATKVVLTHTDIGDLDAPWEAIRIGYVQTDGSNKGTLSAWINRK